MSNVDIWGIDDFSFDEMSDIDETDLIDESNIPGNVDENTVNTLSDRIASDVAMFALNNGTLSAADQVQFVTRHDEKVCDICDGLDQNIYDVDRTTGIIQDGPVIPDDTHPNCRCRYMLMDNSGNIIDEIDTGL